MKVRAELHVHLEGTLTPETVCALDPAVSLEDARERCRFSDFAGFIQSYIWVNRHLSTPERYALAARRFFLDLASQGVRYAEVNLSAGVVLWKGQDLSAVFDAVEAEALRSPVQVRWILDAVRQWGPDEAAQIVDFAAARLHRGVIGFGIGGDESRGPVRDFRTLFDEARRRGLAILPHAGETCGPDSVWGALECGAARIGHGIRSMDDPVLVRHLADHGIPLEISITSNLCTGAVKSLAEHPVRRLYDAGVPVTLNTDDPGLFGTTLTAEFELARRAFGFGDADLAAIAGNAEKYAIATDEHR